MLLPEVGRFLIHQSRRRQCPCDPPPRSLPSWFQLGRRRSFVTILFMLLALKQAYIMYVVCQRLGVLALACTRRAARRPKLILAGVAENGLHCDR